MKRKGIILISAVMMIFFILPFLMLTAFANVSNMETEIIPFGDESTALIGDGNEDGITDAKDLILLTGVLLADSEYSKVFDCNSDGVLDIRDLVKLKRHIASGTPIGRIESNS